MSIACLFGFHQWDSYHIKPLAYRTCTKCRRIYQWVYDGFAPYWQRTGETQSTFVYCPNCRLELCAGGDLVEDTDLVRYKCARCGTASSWLFDAPVPIFIEEKAALSPQPRPRKRQAPDAKQAKEEQ